MEGQEEEPKQRRGASLAPANRLTKRYSRYQEPQKDRSKSQFRERLGQSYDAGEAEGKGKGMVNLPQLGRKNHKKVFMGMRISKE